MVHVVPPFRRPQPRVNRHSECYVRHVGTEPDNAAADFSRTVMEFMNDREFMTSDQCHRLFGSGFMRFDHRRITAQPPADRDQWLAGLVTMEQLGGRWPTFGLTEVLAVRGTRLLAYRMVIVLGEMGELDFIVVGQCDETIERAEFLWMYDPEDVDAALDQLDRTGTELARS